MYVVATVAQVERKDVLTVPLEAVEIKTSDQGSVLLVNSQDVLEERDVHLGLESSTRVEVISGLSEGDRVVIGSRNEFRVGMKVKTKAIDTSEPGASEAR